ncbi:hypothetical protein UCRNP2_3673 [Neofusicoccum parvum UCRNP2]|uniref:Uncharacterized protein n=1 Tax=Botryosphaeria parva (strain UCR-NP2) TaxID=1287680 RepID=R1EP93_BOTPV|nr:hypothetical protein UCRNP2_3673 [Neofusicoccum parvum UCRNP2]
MKKKIPRASLQQEKARRSYLILANSMVQTLMKATNQQYRGLTFHVRAFEHLSTVVNRQNARVQEMDEALDAHQHKIQELRYDLTTNIYEPFKYDVEDDIRNSFIPDCSKRDVVNKWLPNVGENTTAAPYGPEPEQHCDSAIHGSVNTPSYEDAYDTSSSKPDISDGPQMEAAAPDPATAPTLSLASAVPITSQQQQDLQPDSQNRYAALPLAANLNPRTSQAMPQTYPSHGNTGTTTAQSTPPAGMS